MSITKTKSRNNVLLFSSAAVISIFMWIGAAVALKGAFSGELGESSALKNSCISSIKALGFSVDTKKDGAITAAFSGIEKIESTVYKSGAIMGYCPSYTLYDFCAGAGCLNPGVSFTINPIKE